MKQSFNNQIYSLLTVVFFSLLSSVVFAETTIVNSIQSTASTGNNTAQQGSVSEGSASSSASIQTVVNGKTIEPVVVQNTIDASGTKTVEKKIEFTDPSGSVSVTNAVRSNVGATTITTSTKKNATGSSGNLIKKNVTINEIEVPLSGFEKVMKATKNYFASIGLILRIIFRS